MKKIPATIVTGFLGAGKTTLVAHLLENSNRRIALIINEFGDLGYDRDALLGCSIKGCKEGDVVELANGCICCTVADEFLPAMEMLLERSEPFDHIVIETSGLALPKPLVKAFGWPEIRSRVTVDGVISVIDAPAVAAGLFANDPKAVQKQREDDDALDHATPLEEVFFDQLSCADMVILNKTDLVSEGELESVKEILGANLASSIKVVPTIKGMVSTAVVLGLGAAVEDQIDARPSIHDGEEDHDHDDFESFAMTLDAIDDPEDLETRLLGAIADHNILRIKGFVSVNGKDIRHVVQGVGGRIQRHYDRPWRDGEARRSELVVIGGKGLDRAAILDYLASCGAAEIVASPA
jgi:cobalamin biosynthesis protein CobW